MSAKKRQYESDSEESFMEEDDDFYNDPILDPIDVHDVSFLSDDYKGEKNDPLFSDVGEIDSEIDEDEGDELCSDERNWLFDFESNNDPFANDEENFESDFESDSEDSDYDVSSDDESVLGTGAEESEPLRSKGKFVELIHTLKYVPFYS